jgi:hypothetical protein
LRRDAKLAVRGWNDATFLETIELRHPLVWHAIRAIDSAHQASRFRLVRRERVDVLPDDLLLGRDLEETPFGTLKPRQSKSDQVYQGYDSKVLDNCWLIRVSAAATLVGPAWIDAAPPLELTALIIAVDVGIRVVTPFGKLADAAPFKNQAPRLIFAVGALALLALSFATVAIFVGHRPWQRPADGRTRPTLPTPRR